MSLRLFGSSVPSFSLICLSEMSMGFTLAVNKIHTEKCGPQLMPENLLEGGKKELLFSRVAIEFWNRHLWRLFSSTYFRSMSLPAPFLTRAFMPGGGGLAEWPVQSSTQTLLCLSSRSFCFPLLPSSLFLHPHRITSCTPGWVIFVPRWKKQDTFFVGLVSDRSFLVPALLVANSNAGIDQKGKQ